MFTYLVVTPLNILVLMTYGQTMVVLTLHFCTSFNSNKRDSAKPKAANLLEE